MTPANEGVGFLVGRLADEAPGAAGWMEAARMTAAAEATGWQSWEQVAAELEGLTEDLDLLTAEAAQARFGSALDDVDDAGLVAALLAVDAEATEPRCSACDRIAGMFLGRDGWWHIELDETSAGWRRTLLQDAGHSVDGPVWRYGGAALPVEQVGCEPAGEDFDAVGGRDRVLMAGAELLGVVHDIDFHHYADGGWTDPWYGDTADAAGQIRWITERLERAAAAARVELDAVERMARVQAAHRQRGSAGHDADPARGGAR